MKHTISLTDLPMDFAIKALARRIARAFAPNMRCNIKITNKANGTVHAMQNIPIDSGYKLADHIITRNIREYMIPEDFGAVCQSITDGPKYDACIEAEMGKVIYEIEITAVII